MNKIWFIGFLFFTFLASTAYSQVETGEHLLWPLPHVFTQTAAGASIIVGRNTFRSPNITTCTGTTDVLIQSLLNHYRKLIFEDCHENCHIKRKDHKDDNVFVEHDTDNFDDGVNGAQLHITVQDCSLCFPSQTTNENYTLDVTTSGINVQAGTYFGLVRAIETLSQLIHQTPSNTTGGAASYSIGFLPIHIEDWPDFSYRGIQVDTSRHFIPVEDMLRTIDAMSYNKLNVLHWHLTDGDSFPIELKSYPVITQYGAYNQEEVYSQADITKVVWHALKRGVRVIPELDAPGHARSWALSPELADIGACLDYPATMWDTFCASPPCGQLDPTNPKTYTVYKAVFDEIAALFPEQIVHLGGDEVNQNCWKNKTSIVEWMSANNMTSFHQLELDFRKNSSLLIRSDKRRMYWVITNDTYLAPGDIVHYWGATADIKDILSKFPDNDIVMSPWDNLYLDCGLGNLFGDGSWCGKYRTWKDIYDFNPVVNGTRPGQVLGAEVQLWAELNNADTLDTKMWARASALAERLWNTGAFVKSEWPSIVRRLIAQEYRMRDRCIGVNPITSEWCSLHVDMCFFPRT